ncbi:hypothetical protein OV090_05865 [Nannocystis sp. RBIL2]|uniref:hypothetical protein n=1 Tax=Nannocystis sp. RBIL2 TaxID=2996788 RepID=UPI002270D7E2|nr:hypothetical protein [Nannocystis sp. RBIL2]MCY1064275.1 hypothetical protein [Nannocystis sp. RBIL2]
MADDTNDSAAVVVRLQAAARARHEKLRAAIAAGEPVPLARSRFRDDTGLRIVSDSGPRNEPPLLPGAHNKG